MYRETEKQPINKRQKAGIAKKQYKRYLFFLTDIVVLSNSLHYLKRHEITRKIMISILEGNSEIVDISAI